MRHKIGIWIDFAYFELVLVIDGRDFDYGHGGSLHMYSESVDKLTTGFVDHAACVLFVVVLGLMKALRGLKTKRESFACARLLCVCARTYT